MMCPVPIGLHPRIPCLSVEHKGIIMNDAISKSTRRTLLIFAGAIFVIAVVWLILLESRSYTRAVCTRINSFGYSLSPSDLFTQGYGADTSISAVIGKDITEPVRASKERGFDSDTEKSGLVELMLYDIDPTHVMYIWLLDREPQLVFIEDLETGGISSI